MSDQVQRTADDPRFFLFTLGERMSDASRPPTEGERAMHAAGINAGMNMGQRVGITSAIAELDALARVIVGPDPSLTDDGAVALAALRVRLRKLREAVPA